MSGEKRAGVAGRIPPEAVLFDLDGVLVHSGEAWFLLTEESGRVFRGSPITREEFAPTFGQSTEADIAAFGLRCTTAELDRFYAENFRRFAKAAHVASDVRPTLERLREQERRLAVVTNTATALAHELLGAAGILELFHAVACSDQVEHPKPAADLVFHALRQVGAPPEAACMVGDSAFDRTAARAAGVHFVGLGLDGDARIESLAQLLHLVG